MQVACVPSCRLQYMHMQVTYECTKLAYQRNTYAGLHAAACCRTLVCRLLATYMQDSYTYMHWLQPELLACIRLHC